MTASKRTMRNTSKIESDLAKIDAHVITPEEYEEIPELTDAWFQEADFYIGDKLVRRGRPLKPDAKQQVTLRLAPDVLGPFKASGKGWQTRIEDVLRAALKKGVVPGGQPHHSARSGKPAKPPAASRSSR